MQEVQTAVCLLVASMGGSALTARSAAVLSSGKRDRTKAVWNSNRSVASGRDATVSK